MMLTEIESVAFRVHDPKWGYMPVSGIGAGTHGGRANRPGLNALYLSLDLETALAEYQQTDFLLPPGLMVCYQVRVAPVADFCFRGPEGSNELWQDFYCDWRRIYFNQNIEPPSWILSEQVLADGGKGILFTSKLTGGTNLVIYTDYLTPNDSVVPYDPDQALPKNQESWR